MTSANTATDITVTINKLTSGRDSVVSFGF